MARALPVGSEIVVANPAFSALAALGLEDSVVQMGSADASILVDITEAIPDVVAHPRAATDTDLVAPVTATIASVAAGETFAIIESLDGAPELMGPAPYEQADADAAESASDPVLVIVPFD